MPNPGRTALLALFSLAQGGCADACRSGDEGGGLAWYRAEIAAEEAAVPFFLGVPGPGEPGPARVANGKERLEAPCTWDGDTVTVEFPVFGSEIVATRREDGSLEGRYRASRIIGASDPLSAQPVERPDPARRFDGDEPPATDVTGTWRFELEVYGLGKGTFEMTESGAVTGTVLASRIGDLRYLAGSLRGDRLRLSTFDGQHAYYLEAEVDERLRRMQGTWVYPHVWTDPFIAKRAEGMDDSALHAIRLKPGHERVTIPQLDDPRYRGEPVIVDYFGTWCPACMDETPFLVELYERYRDQDLEILSIALEGTEDDDYNRERVEAFRRRYGVEWDIEIVPGDFDEIDQHLPPELEGTGGYPVTIFLRRDGTVRAVHSGFFSPADRQAHEALKARFTGYVEDILDSPAPR